MMRARVVFPTPRGPVSKIPVGIFPCAMACFRVLTMMSWSINSSKS